MCAEDLSGHKCEHREPIMSTYRGYHIYEVAPPTAVRTLNHGMHAYRCAGRKSMCAERSHLMMLSRMHNCKI